MAPIVDVDEYFPHKILTMASFYEVWFLLLCIDISLQKELLVLIKWDFDFSGLPLSLHYNVFELLPVNTQDFSAVIF